MSAIEVYTTVEHLNLSLSAQYSIGPPLLTPFPLSSLSTEKELISLLLVRPHRRRTQWNKDLVWSHLVRPPDVGKARPPRPWWRGWRVSKDPAAR